MKKNNIIPIVAIVLAFLLICAALCCAFISIGTEFDLYNKIFGNETALPTETAVPNTTGTPAPNTPATPAA